MTSKLSSCMENGGYNFMKKYERQRVLDLLKNISKSLSPKQRKLADYIAKNYVQTAFMNAATLAYNAGVSESTVTRLISVLGYLRYTEFQAACQDMVQKHISSLERFPLEFQEKDTNIYDQVMVMETQLLNRAKELIAKDTMDAIVDLIYEVKDVVIVGTVANLCLAEYASFFLSVLGPTIHKITREDPETLLQIRKIPSDSLAIVFSFPRYPRPTQNILECLSEKKIPIVGITDSLVSPIIPFTKYPLIVPQQYITFMDPFGAVMAMIHALFTGVYVKDKEGSHNKVELFDKYCKSQDFLTTKEINVVDLL